MTLDWQDVAFGVFFFVVVLRIVVSRFLANELRRYAPTAWELLGKPVLYGESSNRIFRASIGIWQTSARNLHGVTPYNVKC